MTKTPAGRRLPPYALLLVPLLSALALLGHAEPATAATPAQTLRDRVQTAIRGSTAGALGMYVAVDGLGTVVSHNATARMPPASTEKSLVALTALLRLGADTRLLTEVSHTGAVDGGFVHGDLVLTAGGDPALTGTHLQGLANRLRDAGVHSVLGELFVDDSRYDRVRRAPGWKPHFVPEELGPLSAFVVDRNTWRRDSAYLAEPALPNLGRFASALGNSGITVFGGSHVGRPVAPTTVLASHASPTVSSLVTKMLKDSDNLYAEMLTKELGFSRGTGSTSSGAAAINEQAARFGMRLGSIADGSGLSAYDRETPVAETTWLNKASTSAVASLFRAALPVACRDGTLEKRFCGTAASGRVSAKTGTLSGVHVLAGYTSTASGRPVRFSFMISGASSGSQARAAIDRAVVQIAAFRG